MARRDPGPQSPSMAPAAVHQILLNLLLNARDAMPAGGRVTIVVEPAAPDVRVSVRDAGPGMNAEQRRRAFESFYTTKRRGSGLGLAVVRSMLELYGGGVSFETAEGQGTTFTLRMPATRPDRAPRGSGADDPAQAGPQEEQQR